MKVVDLVWSRVTVKVAGRLASDLLAGNSGKLVFVADAPDDRTSEYRRDG